MMSLVVEKFHITGRILTKALTVFPLRNNPKQYKFVLIFSYFHGMLKEENLLIKSIINRIYNEPKFSPFTMFQ